jgi:hypothetical protein
MTTTDPVIQRLRDDLANIEKEIRRHQDRAEHYQRQAERHVGQADQLTEQADHFRSVLAFYEPEAADSPGDSATDQMPTKAMKNAMWKILEAEGQPLHYREICQRLIASGFRVPGQDPARNVNAHLSADIRFSNVGRGLWGLNSWKPPPAFVPDAEAHGSEVNDDDPFELGIADHDGTVTAIGHLGTQPRQDDDRLPWESEDTDDRSREGVQLTPF